MTDKHTTQGRKQGDHQSQFAKDAMEMERNETQQLPNAGLTSSESNNWSSQNWNSIDWGSFDYYNWGRPMVFWENLPETKEKGKQKGGAHSVGWASSHIPRPDPAGEAYARSEWALKTNERSVAKQMPLLGDFAGYSEWGE